MRNIFTLGIVLLAANALAQDNYRIQKVWQKAYGNSVDSSSYPVDITEFNGAIYFIANDSAQQASSSSGNRHLYKLTPSSNELTIVPFPSGTPSKGITDLTLVKGELYFRAGFDSFKLDANNRVESTDNHFVFDAQDWAIAAGKLYFIANSDSGRELYVVNNNIPELVKDINTGAADSVVSDLAVFNNELYFSATDGTNQLLYKLSPEGNSLSPIASYSSEQNIRIPSVVANEKSVYYNLVGSDTRIIKYDGSSQQRIYQDRGVLDHLGVVNNDLLLWGKTLGYTSYCELADYGYSATLIDQSGNTASCIWNSAVSDFTSGSLDYHFDEQNLVIDVNTSSGGVLPKSQRSLYKVDLSDGTTNLLYQYETCYSLGEKEFQCTANNYASAMLEGSLYSMTDVGDFGVELLSIDLANGQTSTTDVNTYINGYLNLRPIKAERNLLYLQPYSTEVERQAFTRDYLVYDYFGATNEAPFNWLQGESFLFAEGLGPYISQNKFTPDTTYYKGLSYANYYPRAMASFTKGSSFYWLDVVNDQLNLLQTQSDEPISYFSNEVEQTIRLDVELANLNDTQEPIPNILVQNSFYFALPYSNGVERLYQYDFTADVTKLIGEYSTDQIKQMAATPDAAYMLKQESVGLGLYKITGDQVTLVHNLFSVDLEAGLKSFNGDLYYTGVNSAGQTPSLFKWSSQQQTEMNLLDDQDNLLPQSFSYFDERLFFIAQERNTGAFRLFKLNEEDLSISAVELPDGIAKPLDLIRYARGLYFQAENTDGNPALFSLTIDGQNLFPVVANSEAKASGRQGEIYTSSFAAADAQGDDADVFVLAPSWLSYNKAQSQFEGSVPQAYLALGDQQVTAVIDDGALLTIASYPVALERVISLPTRSRFNAISPPARFGKKWSVKLEFRDNVNTGEPLVIDLKVTRSDTQQQVDWFGYNGETQTVSGFIPDLAMDSLLLNFDISATRGVATDREEDYSLYVEPLNTLNQTLTQRVINVNAGETVEYQVAYVTDVTELNINEFALTRVDGGELPGFISIDENSGLITVSPPANYNSSNVKFGVSAFSQSQGVAVYAEGELVINGNSGAGPESEHSGGAFYFALYLLPFALARRLNTKWKRSLQSRR